MNDRINFNLGPMVEEFGNATAEGKSAYQGIAQMIERGKLGALAKELTELADDIAKSAYVPPAAKADVDKYRDLAKSVGDRDLAKFYRDKARKAADQKGDEMSMSVATARQGNELARIQRQLADLEREIGRGVNDAGGMPEPYLVSRMPYLTEERKRLTSELADVAALTGDELMERFCPRAPEVQVIPLHDALIHRGEHMPSQVVVGRETHQRGRIGGDPGPVHPESLPAGFVPGEVYTYSS